MRLLIVLALLLVLPLAQAELAEREGRIPIPTPKPQLDLPRCVEDGAAIEKVKSVSKANAKTKFKYRGYKEVLSGDSDEELMARLVYAETLAANCPKENKDVLSLIAETIANRVRLRGGEIKSVVFQRDQFASSLNIYKSSRYKEFLCPKDASLWKLALESTKVELKRANPAETTKQSVHYFLYLHDPRWTKEPWNFEEDPASKKVRDCIRVFKNPKWK